MTEQILSPDVVEFVEILERHGVRYLLIGGHAVSFHGYPRLTADVDFAYAVDRDNAERLYAALEEFWGRPVPVVAGPDELMEEGMVFQFGRPPNRIDLLSRVSGIAFDAAWARRCRALLPGSNGVWVIGLADLRSAKRAAGRPKDLDDLSNLPAVEEAGGG